MPFGMCIFPDLRMFQSILMFCDFNSSRRKYFVKDDSTKGWNDPGSSFSALGSIAQLTRVP